MKKLNNSIGKPDFELHPQPGKGKTHNVNSVACRMITVFSKVMAILILLTIPMMRVSI